MHVHLTDETLRLNHGIVRTDDGPITLEQLQRFLVQHEANVTVQPVTDPAATAPADATRSRFGSAGPWPSGTPVGVPALPDQPPARS